MFPCRLAARERFDYTNSSSHFDFSERLEPGGWFGRTLSLTNTFRLLKNKILPQSQRRAPYLVQLDVSPVQWVETPAPRPPTAGRSLPVVSEPLYMGIHDRLRTTDTDSGHSKKHRTSPHVEKIDEEYQQCHVVGTPRLSVLQRQFKQWPSVHWRKPFEATQPEARRNSPPTR